MEEKEIEYVLCNVHFFSWIIRKLDEHYYIDDHDEKLNENDLFFAKKIKYLYQLLEEYALNNDISTKKLGEYNLYYVNYKGNIFFVYKGNNSYGCFNNTLDKKDLPNCIKFKNVRKQKLDELIQMDNSSLKELKDKIVSLNNKGISLDVIEEIIGQILHNISSEEKGHTYIKK